MKTLTMCALFILAGFMTISLFGRGVQGIECYKCASELGGVCESPSHADGVVIQLDYCTGSCLKYKTNTGYYRQCSYIRYAEGCRSGTYQGFEADVCACNEDLCNISDKLRPSVLTRIAVLLLSFVHVYKYFI